MSDYKYPPLVRLLLWLGLITASWILVMLAVSVVIYGVQS